MSIILGCQPSVGMVWLIRRHPVPPAATSARLVAWCADRLTPFGPGHQWLAHHAT